VGAVGLSGVNARGLPEELASGSGPLSVLQVGAARWILLARGDLEEEQLVTTAVRADELGVSAPVHTMNVGAVFAALALETPVGSPVNVDVVVVGADSQVLAIWGEGHNLVPLSSILEKVALLVWVICRSDRDGTVVSGDGEPVCVGGDGTRALGGDVLGEG